VVNETLAELDDKAKPTLLVFNKIDAYRANPEGEGEEERPSLEELKKTWMGKMDAVKCVFISAQDKTNIDELREVMYEEIKRIFAIRYPYNNFLY
jgi:GTP-binding protein HflX